MFSNPLRIRHAMHELKYSGYTVASISESCGYQSVSYFVRVFRSFTGLSPTQYRKCSL
ncbi:MAG: helix-turn-helix domain-containing protein [Lachnospiraceae bacterium]